MNSMLIGNKAIQFSNNSAEDKRYFDDISSYLQITSTGFKCIGWGSHNITMNYVAVK